MALLHVSRLSCHLQGARIHYLAKLPKYFNRGPTGKNLQQLQKNTSLKLLKTSAAIWFNKICKTKQLTPKYLSIKINGNNRQTKNTRIQQPDIE